MLRWISAAQEPSAPLIRLLVPTQSLQGSCKQDELETPEAAERREVLRLSEALGALQPGAPSAIWTAPSHQQVNVVVRGKDNAAAGYKALASNAAKLGFKLRDVRSTVVLAAMPYEDLQRTAEAAVSHALQSQGWHRLGAMWVRCDFLRAAPGRPYVVEATELAVEPATTSTATLALGFRGAGMYKFCPLWPLPAAQPPQPRQPQAAAPDAAALPAPGAGSSGGGSIEGSGGGSGDAGGGDDEAAEERRAALERLFSDKAALRRAVARLAETRVTVVGPSAPAFVLGLKPLPPGSAAAQRLRHTWLGRFGLQLPEHLGGFVAEVGASPEADPDDCQEVPGCCLWVGAAAASGSGGSGDGLGGGGGGPGCGLAPVPPAQCTAGGEEVVEKLLADLARASSSCFTFWGPGGLIPRTQPPPGAEAALEKRRAAAGKQGGTAPDASMAPAVEAAGPVAKENTGWTAAVEVVTSGFRAAASLTPAAAALRRTIDPDINGGGGCGGGWGGGVSTVGAEAAEALYGDLERECGGGSCGNAAAREPILERASDEALRAAAAQRAANRAKEQGLWAKHRAFRESRKDEEPQPVVGAARGSGGPGGGGGGGAAGGVPRRAPQFGTSSLLGRPAGPGVGGMPGGKAGGAARPLVLKGAAAGRKTAAGAAAATVGKAGAKAVGGVKAGKLGAGKAAAKAKGAAAGTEAAAGAAAAAAAADALPPPKKRSQKAVAAGGPAGAAPAKKRIKAAAPAAAAAPAGAAAGSAAGLVVAAAAIGGPAAPGAPTMGAECTMEGVPAGAMAPAAAPASAAAGAVAAVAADLYENANGNLPDDGDDFVSPGPAAAVATTAAAAAAGAGPSVKAPGKKAGGGSKRSAPGAGAAAAAAAKATAGAGAEAAGDAGVAAAPTSGAEAAAAAVAAAKEPSRKRTKAADLDLGVVEGKVAAAAAAGRLSDLTLPEMQCWLRARKAPVSGKKADVEARLAALLGLVAPAGPAALAGAGAAAVPASTVLV